MFSRLKSIRMLQHRVVRLTHQIQSRSNEYQVDGPCKLNSRSAMYHTYESMEASMKDLGRSESQLFDQKVAVVKVKAQAMRLDKQERHDILQSSFPKEICTLDEIVYFNYHKNDFASEDAHSMNARNNYSMLVVDIMRTLVHQTWIFHRSEKICGNLMPQNIFVSNKPCIDTRFIDRGCDSLGWKAPEQLLYGRQTKASDMFNFGCILFFCITGGGHPFGNDPDLLPDNIKENKMDLSPLKHVPEAFHLVSHLLSPDPDLRPNVLEVLSHPLFKTLNWKMFFLKNVCRFIRDDVEKEFFSDEKLLRALKTNVPILADKTWVEKYYHCTEDILRNLSFPDKNLKLIFGPAPQFDFLLSLVVDIYKVVIKHSDNNLPSAAYLGIRRYVECDRTCYPSTYL